ncbi:MAG: asparagine synthase-related protein [Gammaproteobacteria bacterium]
MRQTGQASALLGTKLAAGAGGASEGLYVEWNWDGEALTVHNDRYGIYPLYWFQQDGDFGLSPSIPTLIALGAPRDWDDDALAVLLRYESCLGEDTPFRAIRALPPGASLIWRAGQVTLTRVRPPVPKPFDGSRDEAIDRFIELFRAAIRRRPPPESGFGVPLSGGRDSRHILLELLETGWRPTHCVSTRYHPPRPDNDARIAAQLAALADIEHATLEQPRSQLGVLQRHYRLTNYCSTMPAFFLWAVSDYLHGRTQTVYDGLAGDALSAGQHLTPERLRLYEAGRFEDLAELHLKSPGEGTLRTALAPSFYRRWSRDRAIAHLARELQRHAGAPNPIGAFTLFNRTRRNTALQPCRIFNRFPRVYCPYLDHALYDFLASLSARMLLDRAFHTDTIRRAYPRFAACPFGEYDEAPLHRDAHYRRFLREVTAVVLTHPRSNLLHQTAILPRLARCAVDRGYRSSINWIGQRAVYLLGLEALADSDRHVRLRPPVEAMNATVSESSAPLPRGD